MFNTVSFTIEPNFAIFILIATLWSLPWKGVALWKAANKKDTFWFVVLLILNTVGILEILYIFWLSKIKDKNKDSQISNGQNN